MSQFTLDDLRRVMRVCAGEDAASDLDGDIAQRPFDELGYDSLALLETASRIEREYRVALPDDLLGDIHTPADFVALVNRQALATAG
jgi:minimal PKS acyl carrier protein